MDDNFQGSASSDDDDEDDEDEEEMDIERKSKKLKAKKSVEDQQAEAELQMNIQQSEKYTLPSGEEVEKETLLPPDLTVLKTRINEVVRFLLFLFHFLLLGKTQKQFNSFFIYALIRWVS